MKYLGSCLCGEVHFEIEGAFEDFYLCHCEKCRKDTGSAHAANLFSTKAKLKWLSGKDNVKTYNHKNEGHIKSFCMTCGSALPNMQMDGTLLVVPAGSLDSDINIKPSGHIFYESKANWDQNLEKAKKYKDFPSKE
jgi:hypothetical protein